MFNFSSLPILDDFEVFLTFLKSWEKTPLTNEAVELKWDDLFWLNGEMHQQARWVTTRSRQFFYPQLDFFFKVVVAGKLVRIYREEKNNHLKINPEPWERYRELTPTEQYFFLLETFWTQLDWGKLCEMRSFYFDESFFEFFQIAAGSPAETQFLQIPQQRGLMCNNKPIYLALSKKIIEIFDFLGFYDLIPDHTLTKKPDRYSFPYEKLVVGELSPLLLPILLKQRPFELWNQPYRIDISEGEVPLGITEAAFYVENKIEGYWEPRPPEELNIPMFPDAFQPVAEPGELTQSLYTNPTLPTFVDGTYIFKVALNKSNYHVIALSASDTLHDLHLSIQDAFEFGNDHLYAFYMDADEYSSYCYSHPESQIGSRYADQAKIGELDLYPGRQVLYKFDFGASWHFLVTLLEINSQMPQSNTPRIIESKGKNPPQYDWEDEE